MTDVDALSEPAQSLREPRELLLAYLDAYRAAVLQKLDGLSGDELRTSRLPSGWTPLELLNHLAYVELRWVHWGFNGERLDSPWADAGPGGRWHVPGGRSAADVRRFFMDTCARSRKIIEGAGLTQEAATGGRFSGQPPALSWILVHLLQEYARHLGHLDIARELADGTVGE
ncbi:MAG: DinB family protein [Streptosporangiaceae bacterium]|nr:DinB family protein [Streptosporangiaceae bacterium]MBV9853352.1 DinB family protein [Streptosporangiaceae bacterium]